MIKRLDDKKWSKPVNAGLMINSRWDEESPRFSENGDTLFFSSRGHNSIGGFDVFFSARDASGIWGQAVNFGFPVNTQWDELFYFPLSPADSLFYFASNRPESRGGLDIFRGRFIPPEPARPDTAAIKDTAVVREVVIAPPPPPPPPPAPVVITPKEVIIYLAGRVRDSETGDPVQAKIEVTGLSADAVADTTESSGADGSFKIRLPGKKSFMVDVSGEGFLSYMKRVDLDSSYAGETYNLDVPLIKLKVGKKVALNNIFFQTGKSILTAASYTELDRLFSILVENPQMKIEISGHTDKTGSEPLNFKLSEARAKAVVDHLLKKGVDASRLEYRGFGSLQPVADNATTEGRTKNRRVEFKILEF